MGIHPQENQVLSLSQLCSADSLFQGKTSRCSHLSESERLQWDSGSGQHNIYELQHIDTAVLVCDGSLCRVCKADRCLLETAANELLSAGFRVLIALHNCHPELRYT